MNLRLKIVLIITGMLLFTVLSISAVTIYSINKKGKEDLINYEVEEFEKIKKSLKDVVDVSSAIIEMAYDSVQNDEVLLSYIRGTKLVDADSATLAMSSGELLSMYGEDAKQELMRTELDKLSKVRFDNGEGYFWVTNNTLPYPTMIMHAAKPQNEGKVMSDLKYNTEKYEERNIYQLRVELANKDGEGFVEYTMNKPDSDVIYNKLSFSKLHEPTGWVISTGKYTDQIQEAVKLRAAKLSEQRNQAVTFIVVVSLIMLGGGVSLIIYFSNWILRGVSSVSEKLKLMALGQEVAKIDDADQDELGQMQCSLNDLVDGRRTYVEFAREIGSGNLSEDFNPLSDEDVLGNELLNMRDSLVKASEEEKRRSWTTEGLAKFGEILRSNNRIADLGDKVLSTLVDYLNINQGALYVINDDDEDDVFLEMVACYAYRRKKYLHTKVEPGDGLVGESFLEKSPIYLKEVPQSYVNITSGLGSATPSYVAMFPLINNEEVYGVLEIASFDTLADYEKEFMVKLCESIATTISAVQINEKTKNLLEESQKMGEEMRAQEEELRQNQEEMQATQEEMERKQTELEQENNQLRGELEEFKASYSNN
ncbi:MAG: cache domain-containing protein [Bacteroidota bacterium]